MMRFHQAAESPVAMRLEQGFVPTGPLEWDRLVRDHAEVPGEAAGVAHRVEPQPALVRGPGLAREVLPRTGE